MVKQTASFFSSFREFLPVTILVVRQKKRFFVEIGFRSWSGKKCVCHLLITSRNLMKPFRNGPMNFQKTAGRPRRQLSNTQTSPAHSHTKLQLFRPRCPTQRRSLKHLIRCCNSTLLRAHPPSARSRWQTRRRCSCTRYCPPVDGAVHTIPGWFAHTLLDVLQEAAGAAGIRALRLVGIAPLLLTI
ncbi:hypothetical protein DFH94DRAFT_194064 [Russula ochroleuca]|jgi:hypothetical protein|uniref:Uncharacterized protein n=1 Tax=Russula ochroleuca TaxID=152965 RepID=A0A9P5K0B2_9AGAM|nr:hypothetical protein DFH94DRAFT_194064 [Russula ochroleuca]